MNRVALSSDEFLPSHSLHLPLRHIFKKFYIRNPFEILNNMYVAIILLIDANILLDVLMNRQEFVKDSSIIWKLCETEKAKGYVSALTFASLAHIMRKQLRPEAIEDICRKFLQNQENM